MNNCEEKIVETRGKNNSFDIMTSIIADYYETKKEIIKNVIVSDFTLDYKNGFLNICFISIIDDKLEFKFRYIHDTGKLFLLPNDNEISALMIMNISTVILKKFIQKTANDYLYS